MAIYKEASGVQNVEKGRTGEGRGSRRECSHEVNCTSQLQDKVDPAGERQGASHTSMSRFVRPQERMRAER